jgi:hypothetical protein
MGGGGGGHMGGGWGGHSAAPLAGGARMGAWSGTWLPGMVAVWLPGTVTACLLGMVVPAIGIAFITATLSIAMDGFSSSAGLGGVVSATTTVVAGSGSRPDGVRSGSGSVAATSR